MNNIEETIGNIDVHTAETLLELAIINVSKRYVCENSSNETEEIIQQVERAFAYELYHQWSNILDAYYKVNPTQERLILNGEVSKKIIETNWYPDLVLHAGQNDKEAKNQLLICEIKRITHSTPSAEDLLHDLYKLANFIQFDNSENRFAFFQNGIFITINPLKRQIYKEIKGSLKQNNISTKESERKTILINANRIIWYDIYIKDGYCEFKDPILLSDFIK